MMNKVVKVLGIMLYFSTQLVFGQSDSYTAREKKIYWDAENLWLNGHYLEALEGFQALERIDQSYEPLFFRIGKAYFELEQYNKALPYLRKAGTEEKDIYFQMAFIHLYNEELDSAAHFIKRYEKKTRFSKQKRPTIEAEQLKKNIANANSFLDNPEDVEIVNLGSSINSKYDEYVPLITADESLLMFTSRRDETFLDPLRVPFEDIYFAENTGERFSWTEAKKIEGEVNTDAHDACVGLSPDGNTLFVFKTHENLVTGDLYESKQEGGIWSKPVKMNDRINTKKSIEPSASISLDGLTLYFSSDREGGYGGFDLYQVKKIPNGEWSLPTNLGPDINTPFDEDAPFIHPNGKTLYFSSKGHENMGGYDVFRAEFDKGVWTNPMNLGVPTNTTKDDIYFTISADERHGYYSSEKSGGLGGQDIYVIDYLEKELRQSVIRSTILLEGKPTKAEISLFNSQKAALEGIYISDEKDGEFIFLVNPNTEYELLVEGEGAEQYSQTISFNVKELTEKQHLFINLKPTE